MRTAGPAARLTVSTAPGLKQGAWAAVAGTSPAWADAGVGGAEAATTSTRMVFSLSVKLTPAPSSRRAQPSGTLSRHAPDGGLKETKAWLSGMSPGVLTSPLPAEPACWEVPAQVPAEVAAAGALDAVVGLDDDRAPWWVP